MIPRRHLARLFLAGAFAAGSASAADPIPAVSAGEVRITIRKDGAVIRERMEAEFTAGENHVVFPVLPRETDPSSVTVKDRYGDLELLDWGRQGYPAAAGPSAAPAGRGVTVRFGAPHAFERGALHAHIASRINGRQAFEVWYAVTGMTWRSGYDVLLRGDLEQIDKRLSMDADGWIELENNTGREYADARVTVIGPDMQGQGSSREGIDEPGILELDDDSPLADLWRELPEPQRTPHAYRLAHPVTIPLAGSIRVTHLSVTRKPVSRILVVRAEEIPTDTYTQFAKPSQIIAFKNERDYGGDRALPPGPSLIHVGNQRASINQRAWFNHTPAEGEIRIDMGKVEGIRSRRVNRGQIEIPGGGYEQMFEVRVENKLNEKINVIVDEEPPVFNLAWRLVRSNRPHETEGRRLVFDLPVDPESESVIQYTVRYSLPNR